MSLTDASDLFPAVGVQADLRVLDQAAKEPASSETQQSRDASTKLESIPNVGFRAATVPVLARRSVLALEDARGSRYQVQPARLKLLVFL